MKRSNTSETGKDLNGAMKKSSTGGQKHQEYSGVLFSKPFHYFWQFSSVLAVLSSHFEHFQPQSSKNPSLLIL